MREQLRYGRLLPLGAAADGAWITERAAAGLLRAAGDGVTGVRVGTLRLALADPDAAGEPAVPPPPSALPPGPLRIEAELAATGGRPLRSTAELVRTALATAAADRLGLVVAEVDLRVTELLDADPSPEPQAPAERPAPPSDESATARAVRAVPGVAGLDSVHEEHHPATPHALPAPHVRVDLTVAPGHRALDVAGAVRTAVTGSARTDRPTVSVVVTGAAG
ncbi:nucleopolyhedrovirus P10 family protein [Streptomyces sp. YC537]|uniref:Nucleopolyhedrovirus P10 family protein n=1 Tax=Streptomyces boluensis TaxID=1775135 RepID=A0A964UXX9_9ACTN|nr:nucleopolyhedrovirus P10 family protein [Streptomyces boluensis]